MSIEHWIKNWKITQVAGRSGAARDTVISFELAGSSALTIVGLAPWNGVVGNFVEPDQLVGEIWIEGKGGNFKITRKRDGAATVLSCDVRPSALAPEPLPGEGDRAPAQSGGDTGHENGGTWQANEGG